jgi:hypothetical protein
MATPRNCADGWTVVVHPDGWRYFHSPGVLTDDLELAQQSPTHSLFKRHINNKDYEEYFSLSPAGNVPEKIYVNHALGYASRLMESGHRSDCPSAEEGQIVPNQPQVLSITYLFVK